VSDEVAAQPAPHCRSPPPLPRFVAAAHVVGAVAWTISQPFASMASQLSRPELQLAIAHEPVAHVAVAPVREHETPHAPQSARVLVAVSQPSGRLVSQSPQRPLHDGAHTLAEHAVEPWAFMHVEPHTPQLLRSFARLRQTLAQHAPCWHSALPEHDPPSERRHAPAEHE
jgi:hypothetical protein